MPIQEISAKNISKIFHQTWFSLNSGVLLGASLVKKYLPLVKSDYFLLLPNNSCSSSQSFVDIALKTKKVWRKVRHS